MENALMGIGYANIGRKKAHAVISSAGKKSRESEEAARNNDIDCDRELDKAPEERTKASRRPGNVQRPGNRRKKIRERKGTSACAGRLGRAKQKKSSRLNAEMSQG